MGLIEAITRTCEHVLANLTELKVNLIHSQYKQDLRIDNGAGASILLTGNQVLINGLGGGGGNTFDIIYLGADHLCWIARDLITGDLVFHVNQGNGVLYECVHVSDVPAIGATYVTQTSPTENMNAQAYMVIDIAVRRDILVLFDTSTVAWPLTSAVLRMYLTSANESVGMKISKVQNTFNPATVTWNTQPIYITSATLSVYTASANGATGWVDIDLTDLFNEADNRMAGKFGLNIQLNGTPETATFSSGEGTYPPVLRITE